jgi:NAD(P)-dependent dehydrogenase (short-subunit alcohol dehydrogenase family)
MRVVVVTGCSSGIGLATALAFGRRGDRVYATMRAPERGAGLRGTVDDEGLDVAITPLDVTDIESVRSAIDEIVRRERRIDVVVNNAGTSSFAPIEHSTEEAWLRTLDTNLLGPLRVTRAALPTMRAQDAGTVVNISSIAGRIAPVPTQGAYAASKHALCAFTDSLVTEVGQFGVRAYCIEPGFFATAIMEKGEAAELPDGDPYKVTADAVLQFFADGVKAAPTADVVADMVVAAAIGDLGDAIHHPIGAEGFGPTMTSARDTSR